LKHPHRTFSETYALAQAQQAERREIVLSHLFHCDKHTAHLLDVLRLITDVEAHRGAGSEAAGKNSPDTLMRLGREKLLTVTVQLTPEGAEAAEGVVQAQTNKEKLDELVEILSRRPELLGRVSAALADDEGVQS
jgi:hypothetical protein